MKQAIDNIFTRNKITRGINPFDIIKQIEAIYNEAVEYVQKNAVDERQAKTYLDYSHVLFSKKILDCVKLEDYCKYIEQREILERINSDVNFLRDPVGTAKTLKK